MIGILLYIISLVLLMFLALINFFVIFVKTLYKKRIWKALWTIKDAFISDALLFDRFGNRAFRTLFNTCFKKSEGYAFGNIEETISSVLGKNQRDNTLSTAGKVLVFILDTIDTNHCRKAIQKF